MEIPSLNTLDTVALRAKHHRSVYQNERQNDGGKMGGEAMLV